VAARRDPGTSPSLHQYRRQKALLLLLLHQYPSAIRPGQALAQLLTRLEARLDRQHPDLLAEVPVETRSARFQAVQVRLQLSL
jgi:hypothetical protein